MVCWPDPCFERRCGGARLRSPSRSTLVSRQQSPAAVATSPCGGVAAPPVHLNSHLSYWALDTSCYCRCFSLAWSRLVPSRTCHGFKATALFWPPRGEAGCGVQAALVCTGGSPSPCHARRCPDCLAIRQSLGEARLHPISWSCTFRKSEQFARSFSDHFPRIFLSVYYVCGTVPNA